MAAAELEIDQPFTVADLDATPEDGRRYELIDGNLLVSPAPNWPHQEAASRCDRSCEQPASRDLRVVAAPFDVRPDKYNEVQPDVSLPDTRHAPTRWRQPAGGSAAGGGGAVAQQPAEQIVRSSRRSMRGSASRPIGWSTRIRSCRRSPRSSWTATTTASSRQRPVTSRSRPASRSRCASSRPNSSAACGPDLSHPPTSGLIAGWLRFPQSCSSLTSWRVLVGLRSWLIRIGGGYCMRTATPRTGCASNTTGNASTSSSPERTARDRGRCWRLTGTLADTPSRRPRPRRRRPATRPTPCPSAVSRGQGCRGSRPAGRCAARS